MRDGQKWEVVATDGDFLTTSIAFVQVPGISLCFSLNEAGIIRYYARVVVSTGVPSEIGFRVNGNYIVTVGSIPEYLHSLTTLEVSGILHLPAGVHILELAFRVALPRNQGYPEGPREWSPRKKTIPPALLLKNPKMPATLLAIAE